MADDLDPADLEEKASLEQSLQKHLITLKDLLKSNDKIVRQNGEKDTLLTNKEKVLENLIEQNEEDVVQLDLEKLCLADSLHYELELAEAKLNEHNRLKERYQDIACENENLRDTLDSLTEKFAADGLKFAGEMHKLNKSMQSMRLEMESIFSRKLVDLDEKFQEEAFNSLTDRKKKNLLAHSKLKDELAMQGNGKSNLKVRITRGITSFRKTKKEIRKLCKRADLLRAKLKEVRLVRASANEKMDVYANEKSQLEIDREILQKHLNSWPCIIDLEDAIRNCQVSTSLTRNESYSWSNRLILVKEIESELCSFCSKRKHSFKSNHSRDIDINADASPSLRLNQVREAMDSDDNLKCIFQPLLDKEHLLVISRGSTCIDKNLVAWTVKSIIDAWCHSVDKDVAEFPQNDDKSVLWDEELEDHPYASQGTTLWLKKIIAPKMYPDDTSFKDNGNPVVSSIEPAFRSKMNEKIEIPTGRIHRQIIPPLIKSFSEKIESIAFDNLKDPMTNDTNQLHRRKKIKSLLRPSSSINALLDASKSQKMNVTTILSSLERKF
jgi:hypothetical protein